jgi:hypothetical protein
LLRRHGVAAHQLEHSKALEGVSLADLQTRRDPANLHADLRSAAAVR